MSSNWPGSSGSGVFEGAVPPHDPRVVARGRRRVRVDPQGRPAEGGRDSKSHCARSSLVLGRWTPQASPGVPAHGARSCTGADRALDRSVAGEIKNFAVRIERLADERYPATKVLRQVAGVGPVTALSFVLTLDSPSRVSGSRQVGPYLGLVPRTHDSGASSPQLRITKAGDPGLRRLLVIAANRILGPFCPDCDLRSLGLKLAAGCSWRSLAPGVAARPYDGTLRDDCRSTTTHRNALCARSRSGARTGSSSATNAAARQPR